MYKQPFIDLSNQVFGKLLVVKFVGLNKRRERLWLCKCSCEAAAEVVVTAHHLKNGNTQSCGCLRLERLREACFKDITGQIFGRLTVLKFSHFKRGPGAYFLCRCSCDGREVLVSSNRMVQGLTSSCGCLGKEQRLKGLTSHNMCHTRIYKIWSNMIQRCTNPNNSNYFRYGGRGITVCDRWLSFENFKEDMYESYLKHVEEFGIQNTSIDRFPNKNGNYEPSNCRWATQKEQMRNTRGAAETKDYETHKAFSTYMSRATSYAIRKQSKKHKILEEYFGCSIIEFRLYIQSLWEPWMNWDNYGKGPGKWNIDHINPINRFDLSTEEDKYRCYNKFNLRPYDAQKNNRERRNLSRF